MNEVIKGEFVSHQGMAGCNKPSTLAFSYIANMSRSAVAMGVYYPQFEKRGDKHFSSFANFYRVILTNRRILIVGMNISLKIVTGIRSFEYNEVSKIVMDNIMEFKVYMTNGKYYVFDIYSKLLNDDTKEKSIKAVEYMIDRIEPNRVRSKTLEETGKFITKWVGLILVISLVFIQMIDKVIS